MNEKVLIFLAFVIIFTGMVGWWYFMEYTPLRNQQEELQAEENKLKSELAQGGRIEQEIEEKRDILKKTEEEYEIVKKSVITTSDMSIPDLIRVVRNYAKQTKVEFNEIKISKLFSFEYYDELPIDFNFTGTYHSMGRMMARMENLKLINARKGRFSLAPYRATGAARTTSRTPIGGARRTFGMEEDEDQNEISMDLSASSFMFKSGGGRW
ncbi:MAG: type 4a pilus biogenesis protein PilO [Candidatus Muiribacteriota bacterium]|jgi:Tfp pilus assembly protein PilO